MFEKTVAFVGAGSMAEAMISGLVQSGLIPAQQIIVTNKSNQNRLAEINEKYGVRAIPNDALDHENIDLYILAMKPKDVEKGLDLIRDRVQEGQAILSVLAGISTNHIETSLGGTPQVIRVMPNTSSMLGESATAISKGQFTSQVTFDTTRTLLEMMGEVFAIEEYQMDVFTGIAGSGPAYFYYLVEQIEKLGAEQGLDPKLARRITAQTLLGAAKMIMSQADTPEQLRKKVTSPNGTTAAGLEALMQFGAGEAIQEAVKSAAKRSKEISETLKENLVTTGQ